MASSTTQASASSAGIGVYGTVRTLLRLEGLAVAAASFLLYARTGAPWWLFAILWLVPDLSMLGYRISTCWGARCYNAVHTYVVPLMFAVTALLLHADRLLPFALIWINHIAIDRLLGYGLKYSNGFGWTHLGRLGKQHAAMPAE